MSSKQMIQIRSPIKKSTQRPQSSAVIEQQYKNQEIKEVYSPSKQSPSKYLNQKGQVPITNKPNQTLSTSNLSVTSNQNHQRSISNRVFVAQKTKQNEQGNKKSEEIRKNMISQQQQLIQNRTPYKSNNSKLFDSSNKKEYVSGNQIVRRSKYEQKLFSHYTKQNPKNNIQQQQHLSVSQSMQSFRDFNTETQNNRSHNYSKITLKSSKVQYPQTKSQKQSFLRIPQQKTSSPKKQQSSQSRGVSKSASVRNFLQGTQPIIKSSDISTTFSPNPKIINKTKLDNTTTLNNTHCELTESNYSMMTTKQKITAAENYNLLQQNTPSSSSNQSIKQDETFQDYMKDYGITERTQRKSYIDLNEIFNFLISEEQQLNIFSLMSSQGQLLELQAQLSQIKFQFSYLDLIESVECKKERPKYFSQQLQVSQILANSLLKTFTPFYLQKFSNKLRTVYQNLHQNFLLFIDQILNCCNANPKENINYTFLRKLIVKKLKSKQRSQRLTCFRQNNEVNLLIIKKICKQIDNRHYKEFVLQIFEILRSYERMRIVDILEKLTDKEKTIQSSQSQNSPNRRPNTAAARVSSPYQSPTKRKAQGQQQQQRKAFNYEEKKKYDVIEDYQTNNIQKSMLHTNSSAFLLPETMAFILTNSVECNNGITNINNNINIYSNSNINLNDIIKNTNQKLLTQQKKKQNEDLDLLSPDHINIQSSKISPKKSIQQSTNLQRPFSRQVVNQQRKSTMTNLSQYGEKSNLYQQQKVNKKPIIKGLIKKQPLQKQEDSIIKTPQKYKFIKPQQAINESQVTTRYVQGKPKQDSDFEQFLKEGEQRLDTLLDKVQKESPKKVIHLGNIIDSLDLKKEMEKLKQMDQEQKMQRRIALKINHSNTNITHTKDQDSPNKKLFIGEFDELKDEDFQLGDELLISPESNKMCNDEIDDKIQVGSFEMDQYITEKTGIEDPIPDKLLQTVDDKNKDEDEFSKLKSQVKIPYLPKLPQGKEYTLVLDLDETLIHFDCDEDNENDEDGYYLIRPGAIKFLHELNKYYDLVIFTAAMPDYADWILDNVDRQKVIKHRLYRQHTTPHEDYAIKDLRNLGRSLEKTIIIDNLAENFNHTTPENGIWVESWYDDMDDNVLELLLPFLKDIVINKVKDVRQLLTKEIKENVIYRCLEEGKLIPQTLIKPQQSIYDKDWKIDDLQIN